jgi:hypothetical protein
MPTLGVVNQSWIWFPAASWGATLMPRENRQNARRALL